ncbi:MAG: FKBP-type peptidyl-prolyl cis-trans isomerase [Lachnospiraceae bacterium]|nr:FKBP-type peptidyl-prolyl cis-trans isomerase [Lachnospiraceae bacterium]
MSKKKYTVFALVAAAVILVVALIIVLVNGDDDSDKSIPSDRYVGIPTPMGGIIGNSENNYNNQGNNASTDDSLDDKVSNETAIADFSQGLDTYGMIKDIKVEDFIHINTIEGIKVDKEAVMPSETDVEVEVDRFKHNFDPVYVTESGIVVESGNDINFDFKGFVDDIPFDGGDTEGRGYDYTLGSKKFIDTFDEQLIGHKTGEKFDVFVTFPDPYTNDLSLSGKLARFECVINGVYRKVELTDEFVAANLSEYASNYDEFVEYVRNDIYENNLAEYVYASFIDGCVVTEYPQVYLEQNKLFAEQNYKSRWQYYNYYYSLYYGFEPWPTIYDYMGVDEETYDTIITEDAQYLVKTALANQAVYEKMGKPAMTEEDVRQCIRENGISDDMFAEAIQTYGYPFWYQQVISMKVVQYLIDNVEYVE